MNHNSSLLRTLYSSTFDKYIKFKTRLDKARQSGRFFTLSKRKQHSLLERLERLFEKLKSLQTQLRISGIGAAIALALSAGSAEAQTIGPYEYNPAENPLPPPYRFTTAKPAAVDIDNDGDLDVFVGDKYGNIHFFRNVGDENTVKRFALEPDQTNPLLGVGIGNRLAPAFMDVDGDGDFDVLIGNRSGYTYFFRNVGSRTNPVFEEQTGSSNPFDGITGSSGKYGLGPAAPMFVNIDSDSDLDLIIGSDPEQTGKYTYAPAIKIYENNDGVFTPKDNSDFSALFYYSRLHPAFVDLDADGDLDVLAGSQNNLLTFINTGSTSSPNFEAQYGPWDAGEHTGSILYGHYVNSNSAPFFADFDGDGDLDLIVGFGYTYASPYSNQPIAYFENTDGEFTVKRHVGLNNNPFDGVDVGDEATPSFSDIDGDGDLDAVLGGKYSNTLRVYVNDDGVFTLDDEHSIAEVSMDFRTLPVFVDIDDDGDQDMLVSDQNNVRFFENNNNESFSEEDSPLSIPGSFNNISLALIDVDSDGDFDALVFNHNTDAIEFFRNTGTAESPAFSQQTSPAPFNDLEFTNFTTKLRSVDIDHDGDLDLIVSESLTGKYYYTVFSLFENNGDGTFSPSEADFPVKFEDEEEGILFAESYSMLTTADIDGDGDLDLLLGRGDGTVSYYENINEAPVTEVSTSSVTVNDNSPVILDPDLTVTDSDSDDIVLATVTISDFLEGEEELDFSPAAGITGQFDDEEGILTLRGKASEGDYEDILRTVTYRYTGGSSARKGSSSGVNPPPIQKTVEFQVRDTDFTLTTVSIVNLTVNAEPVAGIVVYNAVSANGDNMNSFMRIEGLGGSKNKVTVYNRWGDQVFETSQYNNSDNRFEGKNDNGKDLPSGTYFYKIEASGKTITGYLSLKR